MQKEMDTGEWVMVLMEEGWMLADGDGMYVDAGRSKRKVISSRILFEI